MDTKTKLKEKIYNSYKNLIKEKKGFIVIELKSNSLLQNLDEKEVKEFLNYKEVINKDIRFNNSYLSTFGLDSAPIESFINITNTSLLKKQEKNILENIENKLIKLKNKKSVEKFMSKSKAFKFEKALLILNPSKADDIEKYTTILDKLNIDVNVCYIDSIPSHEAMILDINKIKYYEELKVEDINEGINMYNIALEYILKIENGLGFSFKA